MFTSYKAAFIVILLAIILVGRLALADVSTVVINEILASNNEQLEDPDEPGEFPDFQNPHCLCPRTSAIYNETCFH